MSLIFWKGVSRVKKRKSFQIEGGYSRIAPSLSLSPISLPDILPILPLSDSNSGIECTDGVAPAGSLLYADVYHVSSLGFKQTPNL